METGNVIPGLPILILAYFYYSAMETFQFWDFELPHRYTQFSKTLRSYSVTYWEARSMHVEEGVGKWCRAVGEQVLVRATADCWRLLKRGRECSLNHLVLFINSLFCYFKFTIEAKPFLLLPLLSTLSVFKHDFFHNYDEYFYMELSWRLERLYTVSWEVKELNSHQKWLTEQVFLMPPRTQQ